LSAEQRSGTTHLGTLHGFLLHHHVSHELGPLFYELPADLLGAKTNREPRVMGCRIGVSMDPCP
jgi:hypothetical protein